jgi:uncharacterized membrane protein YidH (DUF202 family)
MSSSSSSSDAFSSGTSGLPPRGPARERSESPSNFYFLPKNGSFKSAASSSSSKTGEEFLSRPNRALSISSDTSVKSMGLAQQNSLRNASTTTLSSSSIIQPPPPSRSWWSSVIESVLGKPSLRTDSKVEPKIFLSNERTFLAWLDMAVTLAAISVAVLSMSERREKSLIYGLILLPISIGFCVYALSLYMQRNNRLRRKIGGAYNNDYGPIAITTILAVALLSYFGITLFDLMEEVQDPFE